MPKVKFLRSGVEVEVPQGANLRQVALEHGVELYPGIHKALNCRGLGQCGSCRVLLKNGTMRNASPKGMIEKLTMLRSFWTIGCEDEVRLACQIRVQGDLEVLERPPANFSGTYAVEAEAARERLRQGKL